MNDQTNQFTFSSESITQVEIELVKKNKPKKLMQVEECLRPSPVRSFPYVRFDARYINEAAFHFDELKQKWPSKSIKKHMINKLAIKAWITNFKYVKKEDHESYEFLLGHYVDDEIKAIICKWGPISKEKLQQKHPWFKQALKDKRQITILVNPKDSSDIVILGQLELFIIESGEGRWLADTDWQK